MNKKIIVEGNANDLITALKSLSFSCADKKSGREALKGIHFKKDNTQPNTLILESVDSAIGARFTLNYSPDDNNAEDFDFTINSQELIDNLKLCKDKYLASFSIEYNEESCTYLFTVLGRQFFIKALNSEYPNLADTVKKYEANNHYVCITTIMLDKLVKIAKSNNCSAVNFSLQFNENNDNWCIKPINFSLPNNDKMIGVFCPTRR